MKTTIIFEGNVPSKKNSKQIRRKGKQRFIASSDAYAAWNAGEIQRLRSLGVQGLLPPYSIYVDVYAVDETRADLSNKFESIADTLVDAGILEDDNWFVLDEVQLRFGGVDREDPRIEVEIRSSDEN